VDYPKWVTPLERARIDRALDEAAARRVVVSLSTVAYVSDADALAAVLTVLEVVKAVLLPHRTRPDWSDARRHLRDAVIMQIDSGRSCSRRFGRSIWKSTMPRPLCRPRR
jgi:hypothetical protein